MAKSKKSLVGEVLYLVWEDAWHSEHSYETVESIKTSKPYILETVGICIRDDESGITIATDKTPGDEYRHISHRPRYMIKKIKVLK